MKTDMYTKFTTTIIAICLVIIVIRDTDLIQKVSANNTLDRNYAILPINNDGSVTVKLSNADELDVNIKSIETYDELKVNITSINTRDELDINIDEIGGSYVSSGGPIKVRTSN